MISFLVCFLCHFSAGIHVQDMKVPNLGVCKPDDSLQIINDADAWC